MKQRVKLFIFLVAFVAIFGTTACNPLAKISVTDAGMPALNGLTSLQGSLTVDNKNPRDLVVESAFVTIHYKGRELAGAHLAAPVVVSARKMSSVAYEFALDKLSLAMLTALPQAMSSPELVTLDIEAEMSYGGSRKKVSLEKVLLVEIFTTFGAR
jgi:hypothetical protein